MSYSQIKEVLGISKSTLHYWLKDHPLSEARIRELRDWNAQRIERCRVTKAQKREERIAAVLEKIKKRIGTLSRRELFIAGLFLYWGEGSKTSRYTVALTNTDPAMLRFCLKWTKDMGIPLSKIRARLHLYSDMDIKKQTILWSRMLGLPRHAFRNPYVKQVDSRKRKNYKGRFGFGTCSLTISSRDLDDAVSSGLKVLQVRYGSELHSRDA